MQCLLWTIWIQINVKSIQQYWVWYIGDWWHNEPRVHILGRSHCRWQCPLANPLLVASEPRTRDWEIEILRDPRALWPAGWQQEHGGDRGGYGDIGLARLKLGIHSHNTENVIRRNYPWTFQIQTKHKVKLTLHTSNSCWVLHQIRRENKLLLAWRDIHKALLMKASSLKTNKIFSK